MAARSRAGGLCAAGADLINDSWGGWDDKLPEVAAEFGAALVCSHAGGLPPRTRPYRVAYADVVADVLDRTLTLANRAVDVGVEPSRIIIDPAHDFGKNTWHSLEVTRRLRRWSRTGWPVLVSLSNKDFVGETLDVPLDDRLTGTLATTTVCAWLGARVFRAHQVARDTASVGHGLGHPGERAPGRTVRGWRDRHRRALPRTALLVRELSGARAAAASLRTRATRVAAVLAPPSGLVSVVGPRTVQENGLRLARPDWASYGAALPRPAEVAPLSVGLGRALLDQSGYAGPRRLQTVDATHPLTAFEGRR